MERIKYIQSGTPDLIFFLFRVMPSAMTVFYFAILKIELRVENGKIT